MRIASSLARASVGAWLLLAATAAGAQQRAASDSTLRGFPALAHDFVFTTLAFSPSSATQAGLHEWTDPRTGRRVLLDSLLDDFSAASIARQRAFYHTVQDRLRAIRRSGLDAQTQVDYDQLENGAAFGLLGLDRERFTERKPQLYAEVLGNALFANITLDYADRSARAAHLAARLAQVPAYLEVARRNLRATNEVYTRVAIEETEGVIGLVNGLAAQFATGSPAQSRFAQVSPAAMTALRSYERFVRDTLPARGTFDWRAGPSLFNEKWRHYLQVSLTPDQMLRLAEDSMGAVRAEMLTLARPLHDRWFPDHHHTGDSAAVLDAIVGETMARIGDEHAHRDSLLEQGRADVALLERVLREKHLLSIDSVPNLRVIPTPEFMRGIYGVAGAVFAPALEPQLSTFYWVTPIPDAWTAERATAKLREYNDYKMLDITMHEGIPGHVVQGAYANRVTPEWRRLLRAIYGNTPYVEGWAVYAEHLMMYDAGVDGGDPVKMRLTDLKGMLRVYANVVIDIRLHTRAMAGDSAVALMMRDAFQERPEAEAKLQRAQLDYVQLNAYLAGEEEWTRLRRDVERREGSAFDLCRYHDTVLLYGAIPVPAVRRLYLSGVRPSASAPTPACRSAPEASRP